MANQELLDKQYKIPSEVLNYIQTVLVSTPNSEGVKRAKYMLKNGSVTYQVLKRLKNFFDHFNPQTQNKSQYELAGGDYMRAFVERTLNQDRAGIQRSKEVRRDIYNNPKSDLNAYQATPRLDEEDKKELNIKDYDK